MLDGGDGRARLDPDAGPHARLVDAPDEVEGGVGGGLEVEGVLVGPGVVHGGDPLLGLGDHHVHVEHGLRHLAPQALHHRVPERHVGNELQAVMEETLRWRF